MGKMLIVFYDPDKKDIKGSQGLLEAVIFKGKNGKQWTIPDWIYGDITTDKSFEGKIWDKGLLTIKKGRSSLSEIKLIQLDSSLKDELVDIIVHYFGKGKCEVRVVDYDFHLERDCLGESISAYLRSLVSKYNKGKILEKLAK